MCIRDRCTGDDEIIEWCKKLNIKYVKTRKEHSNGTERCAEAGEGLKLRLKDRIVNIQGDEPLIDRSNINLLLSNTLNIYFLYKISG